jgi:hypothetical protein
MGIFKKISAAMDRAAEEDSARRSEASAADDLAGLTEPLKALGMISRSSMKPAIKRLRQTLRPNETVQHLAEGEHLAGRGLFVVTDQRIRFMSVLDSVVTEHEWPRSSVEHIDTKTRIDSIDVIIATNRSTLRFDRLSPAAAGGAAAAELAR